jgi:hypothetical protein
VAAELPLASGGWAPVVERQQQAEAAGTTAAQGMRLADHSIVAQARPPHTPLPLFLSCRAQPSLRVEPIVHQNGHFTHTAVCVCVWRVWRVTWRVWGCDVACVERREGAAGSLAATTGSHAPLPPPCGDGTWAAMRVPHTQKRRACRRSSPPEPCMPSAAWHPLLAARTQPPPRPPKCTYVLGHQSLFARRADV